MEESVNYSEIAKENLAIREHGNSNAREYSRVVETFKKVLDYKEKIRISLEAKLKYKCWELLRISTYVS